MCTESINQSIGMNSLIASTHASPFRVLPHSSNTKTLNLLLRHRFKHVVIFTSNSSSSSSSCPFVACCYSASSPNGSNPSQDTFHTELTTPKTPSFISPVPKLTFTDQAFFLLAFIAATVSFLFLTF